MRHGCSNFCIKCISREIFTFGIFTLHIFFLDLMILPTAGKLRVSGMSRITNKNCIYDFWNSRA